MDDLQGKRILIIDDNVDLLQLAAHQFASAGAQVYTALNGEEGLRQLYAQQPDLVILDIMMPNLTGWETCARIRQICDVPIIFLTALSREDDVVRGLDLGAVDFVTKPYSIRILLARARAALRQAAHVSRMEEPVAYSDDYLTIALDEGRVEVDGKPAELTATELRLLGYLVQNAGSLLTHEQILKNVWGSQYQDSVNYVHVYMRHLRQKLERDPGQPRYLQTCRGLGYRFETQPP